MNLRKIITVATPLDTVFDYLSDFTTTTEWDPGTVRTIRINGDGGVGTSYLNTSRFAGRQTQLTYVVRELVPRQRIVLRGENKSVVATDTMTFRPVGDGTEVTYTANFSFQGFARLLAPLFRPAVQRLGKKAEAGMRQALAGLDVERAT